MSEVSPPNQVAPSEKDGQMQIRLAKGTDGESGWFHY